MALAALFSTTAALQYVDQAKAGWGYAAVAVMLSSLGKSGLARAADDSDQRKRSTHSGRHCKLVQMKIVLS